MNNSNKKKRDDDAAADADNDDDAVDDDAVDENHQQRNKSHKIDESHKIDHDDCPICMEHLLPGEEIYTTKCKHKFHTDCMVKYKAKTRKNLVCPLCRANIDAADIINSKPYVFNEQDFNSNPIIRAFRSNIAARNAQVERAARIAAAAEVIDSDDDDSDDSEFRVGGRFCKSRRYRKSKKGRRKSIKRNSRRKSRRKRLVKT